MSAKWEGQQEVLWGMQFDVSLTEKSYFRKTQKERVSSARGCRGQENPWQRQGLQKHHRSKLHEGPGGHQRVFSGWKPHGDRGHQAGRPGPDQAQETSHDSTARNCIPSVSSRGRWAGRSWACRQPLGLEITEFYSRTKLEVEAYDEFSFLSPCCFITSFKMGVCHFPPKVLTRHN